MKSDVDLFIAIDIGNSNITFGIFKQSELIVSFAIRTDPLATEDNYYSILAPILEREKINPAAIKSAVVSSVVPQLNPIFEKLTMIFFKTKALIVGPGIKTTVAIKTANPGAVGADRIVNALAVREFYSSPAIVVDFGTATTFDYVDRDGAYCGGIIAPGIGISLDALVTKTAKLPRIDLAWPERVLGNDTVPAMRSGVVLGYQSLVEGLLDKLFAEVGNVETVVATGGLGQLFAEKISSIKYYDPQLTLKGLFLINKMTHE